MPAVARQNDQFKTGHPGDAVSKLTGPSSDVFADGIGVERQGDPSVPHRIQNGSQVSTHTVKISGGSSTVFVNGKPIARVGDSIDAGKISTGSSTVFAG